MVPIIDLVRREKKGDLVSLASLLEKELEGLGIANGVAGNKAATVERNTHPTANKVISNHERNRIGKELRKGYTVGIRDLSDERVNMENQPTDELVIEERGPTLRSSMGTNRGVGNGDEIFGMNPEIRKVVGMGVSDP